MKAVGIVKLVATKAMVALRLGAAPLVLVLAFTCASQATLAAPVQHLATQSTAVSGAGAPGVPTIVSFTIPAGKNRVLFIWPGFERDHCLPTEICATGGGGLYGDNFPEPRIGTPPNTTTNNQLTARIQGAGGTLDKKNALIVGGTPSGDMRFINSLEYEGVPAAAMFSVNSFYIALFEDEIDFLLGGAASGPVTITLPDASVPSGAGDDASLFASVFQNVEQTVTGIVRNTALSGNGNVIPSPGNYSIAPTAYDAGQVPNEADDGKLVVGFSPTPSGFLTPSGYTSLSTSVTSNAAGIYDTPQGNYSNEPNGIFAASYFQNGGATPGSLYTLTSNAPSTPQVFPGTASSFLLESDNADISDAPASYGNPTHTISGIRLGASVDADVGLLNSVDAMLDDTNVSDDENGVTIPSRFPVGQTTIVPVNIQNGSGFLNVWFDWNGDGDFADAGEQVATNQAVSAGVVNLAVAVPSNALIVTTFARFRVCSGSGTCSSPRNTAQSGEVEDYQVMLARKIILQKTTVGGVGGAFGFTLTNTLQAAGTITTTASGTPTQVDGDTAAAGMQAFTVSNSAAGVSITESTLPAGWVITNVSCLDEFGVLKGSRAGAVYTLTAAEVAASRYFTCTYVNSKLARLTLTKTAIGGGATFNFALTGGITDNTFAPNPNPPSTPSVSKVYADVTPNQVITISEGAPSTPNWVLAAINCADVSGGQAGSTITTNITNGPTTLGTADVTLVAGADVTCTFINTRNVDIAIIKNAQGGDGTFNYTVANSSGGTISSPVITTTGGSGLANANVAVPNSGTVTFSITESVPAAYQLTGISCTASSGTLTVNSTNLAAGSVNLTASAGTEASCIYTNVRKPTITLRKQSNGGTASFSFGSGTNGLPGSLTLDTSLGNPASGGPYVITSATSAATIIETIPPGWSLVGWACVDSSGVTQASGSTATLTVSSAVLSAGKDLTCTFTNNKDARLRLQKALPNGRYAAGDQFTLNVGPIGFIGAQVTTTGSGTTATGIASVSPAVVGTDYGLSEVGSGGALLSNYVSSYSCTNALSGGQTPSGSGTSFQVVPAIGDDLLCTFTNVRNLVADLRLTKTNTPGANGEVDQAADTVTSGSSTNYSIVVSNAGPDAAGGAVVRDPIPTGLSCATASCTSSGGASCPVETGGALVTALQSVAGAAIPVFPANSSVTVTLQCVVP